VQRLFRSRFCSRVPLHFGGDKKNNPPVINHQSFCLVGSSEARGTVKASPSRRIAFYLVPHRMMPVHSLQYCVYTRFQLCSLLPL
jgi:hypothetical protein